MLKIFHKVVQFRIYGNINEELTKKVHLAIKNCKYFRPKMVALTIQASGSLVQAQNIALAIRNYANGVPMYCFAEDFNLNSALALLTAGDKCFASKYSALGDFGYVMRREGYKGLIEKLGIQRKYIHSGENKVRLNQYEDLKEQDIQWAHKLLEHRENKLFESISKNRNMKIKTEQLKELSNYPFIDSYQAIKFGLIDEIHTFDSLINLEYKGYKIHDAMQNKHQKYIGYAQDLQPRIAYI